MRRTLSFRHLIALIGIVMVVLVTVPKASPADAATATDLPWLATAGNRIVVDGTSQEVVLRGANVLRSEWDMRMNTERLAIPALASQWKGNVIVRGFASDPVNAADAHYLSMLDEHVSLAAAQRMYVVFAWRSHTINGPQPTMPDARAEQALARLAARYRGVSNVMYALQVEPHDVSWSVLHPRFTSMVDAIHVAASPHVPIVMVPGNDWGRDVSGSIAQPVQRTNVVYKTHPYNGRAAFQRQFLDAHAAGRPVFIGEFGYVEHLGMHMEDVLALMDVADAHRLGWAAWAFDFQGGPALVTDNTTFTATTPYGSAVQARMRTTAPVPSAAAPPQTTVPSTTTTTAPAQPTATTIPRPEAAFAVRIDAGGWAHTEDGNTWAADNGFTKGKKRISTALVTSPTPTTDRSERTGMTAFTIDVPAPGEYVVRLHLTELTHRVPRKRVFSVTAEGRPFATDVDIWASVGKNRTQIIEKRVTVNDGALNLGFVKRIGETTVSGIEVLR